MNAMRNNSTYVLTIATIKMWFRDRTSIVWNFVMPIIIMSIFGVINFGSVNKIDLGIVDLVQTEPSNKFIDQISLTDAFSISKGLSLEEEKQALQAGDKDLILVIPEDFMNLSPPYHLTILYNQSSAQEAKMGESIINDVLSTMTIDLTGIEKIFVLKNDVITDKDFSYIDFLLPGIVAMSIMQMGLFSVAFSFIQLKKLGILRRLFATPVRAGSILFAQVITRLLVSLLQTILLISIAMMFFDVEVVGNVLSMLVVTVIGASVFLCMGFAVAGWAKNEHVAAPLANVIALPMIFLSGIFFGREYLPEFLQTITDYLPLTYLVDAMRNISFGGATIWSQGDNLVGLGIWLGLSFIIANRLFRWE